MRLDPFGMDDAYPLGDGDGDGDHDENPTGERGGPDRLGAVPGSGGAVSGAVGLLGALGLETAHGAPLEPVWVRASAKSRLVLAGGAA